MGLNKRLIKQGHNIITEDLKDIEAIYGETKFKRIQFNEICTAR